MQSEVVDELAHVIRALAECRDVSQLMSLLQEYLGCNVELLISATDGDYGQHTPRLVHGGDSYWISVPLLFDRTRLGWLRAQAAALNATSINLLNMAGRIVSCLLWEEARAHRAWVTMLNGGFVTNAELAAAVRDSGLPADAPVAVMACAVSVSHSAVPVDEGYPVGGPADKTWFKCWARIDRPLGLQPVCFVRNEQLAIFAPVDADEAGRGAQAALLLAHCVQRWVRGQRGAECAVGVGTLAMEPGELPRAWAAALRALDLGTALAGRSMVSDVDSLGILGLVLEHVPDQCLANTCRRMLGPLLDHDADKGTDFCRTLRVFLDADCRYAEASKVLYVHENTLRHRIKRIEEVMGMTLSDPYARSNLYLGLKLLALGRRGDHSDQPPGGNGGVHP